MAPCKHQVLTLLKAAADRLRCRHCHLTIAKEELGSGCCPECLEVYKIQRRDFEEVARETGGPVRYRCDSCGLQIEC